MKRIQPNLFIPGAAKSGTTSLHELLNLHPDICMSSIKEPVFWNKDNPTIPEKIAWYNNLFENKEARILGESTTSYMYFPKFIKQVKTHYSNEPKLIFILRNPIDRCYSHYWWMIGRGQEKRSFEEVIKEDYNRPFKEYDYVPNYYYHFGLYAKWLKIFHQNFDVKNIKIITMESLINNRLETLNTCLRFLNVSELTSIPQIQANKTKKMSYPKAYHFIKKTASGKYKYTKIAKYFLSKKTINSIKDKLKSITFFDKSSHFKYPKISSSQREWLYTLYKEDVSQLKQLTGLSFNEWNDFNNN